MTPDDVAKTLGTCHLFLATGFPEGCPLPPLEAMASGCIVTGFAGYGGWDYMRQAAENGYAPRFALRETPYATNGFFASDGDVMERRRRFWPKPPQPCGQAASAMLFFAGRLLPRPSRIRQKTSGTKRRRYFCKVIFV
jgi:glycosyltransferase involved in cell wall biosynthesis